LGRQAKLPNATQSSILAASYDFGEPYYCLVNVSLVGVAGLIVFGHPQGIQVLQQTIDMKMGNKCASHYSLYIFN
jgi:hypothetical protein